MRTTAWLAGLVLTAGCGRQLNPEYCLHHPDELCYDAGLVFLDAAPPCTENPSVCADPTSVCDTNSGTCVQCTMADQHACSGMTGRCGPDDTCVGCTDDAQCASQLCLLANGTCAPAGDVLYVSVGGTGSCLVPNSPCMLPTALGIARTNQRGVIHMEGGTYATGPNTLDVPNLTIVAAAGQQVILTDNADGPVLVITKGPLTIIDVTVQGAMNDDAIACTNATVALVHVTVQNNPKKGVITNNCDITIDRSTFTGNQEQAIYIDDGNLSIVHNFIVNNGNDQLQSAAVSLHGHAGGEFRFNTVANNTSQQSQHDHFQNGDYAAGLECANDHGVTARDSLFADNEPTTFATDPFKNACGNVYQFALMNWIGKGSDVHFVSSGDYHLTAQTPTSSTQQVPAVRDNGNTSCNNANLKHDIDGQARPTVHGCDYGADEYYP